MSAALDLLRTLVRGALAAEEGRPIPPPRLGAVEVDELLAVVRRHRVAELLHAQAEPLALPPAVVAGLAAWRELARPRLLLQAMETVRACQLLSAEGIGVLAFKGQALAVQTTGRADARGPGDVDLLVPPENSRRIAERIPGSRLVLLPGAPHRLFAENAPAFNREVLGFLQTG